MTLTYLMVAALVVFGALTLWNTHTISQLADAVLSVCKSQLLLVRAARGVEGQQELPKVGKMGFLS